MGCEGGVTVYDAEAIEAEFGADVWERTGFGREHHNPMMTFGGRRYLFGTFNTCTESYGDQIDSIASEFRWVDLASVEPALAQGAQAIDDGTGYYAWAWGLPDRSAEGLILAVRVACWAAEHAKLAERETWT